MGNKATHSFTLMELLVVMVMISILALIAYPAYIGIEERAKATTDMNNLRQIGVATQMYMNDNDGVIFSTSTGTWMSQLQPKYVPAWKVLQSPFDTTRSPSENGTTAPPSPVSYGLNGNNKNGTSIAGLLSNKIANASALILFAPAQTSGTTVAFTGTAQTTGIGVTVYKDKNNAGDQAVGGTHNSRTRINALFADLHVETMVWSKFILDTDPNDASAAQRWDPYQPYP
jgi:prepilin-type N-terminal cleavage/methylation domain-containing protein/prepilin-type processing-associated H-X9-DG protein